MAIYRTNNPTEFAEIDGIVIDETSPPSGMQGLSTNVVALVGLFPRGGHLAKAVGSIGELYAEYGNSIAYSGIQALQNKKFGSLKIVRVEPTSSAVSTRILSDATPVEIITFRSLHKGVYGNLIRITVSAGTVEGRRYFIEDTDSNTVIQPESYDNINLPDYASAAAANAAGIFAGSKLITAEVLAVTANPVSGAGVLLENGSDGTPGDTDYEAALSRIEFDAAANIVFLDVYTPARNTYLKNHAALTQDRMVILAGPEAESTAEAVTAAGGYRDSDGRIIYAYPWVQSVINGTNQFVSPAHFYASLLSQCPPQVDPAYVENSQFLAGITGLKRTLARADFIALNRAGVSCFEYDADIGYKIRNGVTTQVLSTAKIPILRRRMTDLLTNSAARFMKNYQNTVNSDENRKAVKAAILAYVKGRQDEKLLPRDVDIKKGKVTLVDVDSLNSDESIAEGFFYVIWRQRIFSSMRYIILKAEIGTSVSITEG